MRNKAMLRAPSVRPLRASRRVSYRCNTFDVSYSIIRLRRATDVCKLAHRTVTNAMSAGSPRAPSVGAFPHGLSLKFLSIRSSTNTRVSRLAKTLSPFVRHTPTDPDQLRTGTVSRTSNRPAHTRQACAAEQHSDSTPSRFSCSPSLLSAALCMPKLSRTPVPRFSRTHSTNVQGLRVL